MALTFTTSSTTGKIYFVLSRNGAAQRQPAQQKFAYATAADGEIIKKWRKWKSATLLHRYIKTVLMVMIFMSARRASSTPFQQVYSFRFRSFYYFHASHWFLWFNEFFIFLFLLQPNDIHSSPKELKKFSETNRKFNGAKDVSRDFTNSQENGDRGSISDQAFACSASSVESLPSASGSSMWLQSLFSPCLLRTFPRFCWVDLAMDNQNLTNSLSGHAISTKILICKMFLIILKQAHKRLCVPVVRIVQYPKIESIRNSRFA